MVHLPQLISDLAYAILLHAQCVQLARRVFEGNAKTVCIRMYSILSGVEVDLQERRGEDSRTASVGGHT